MGEKISIISNKAQTTRNKITFIYTDDEAQIIFLDTPGIQMPKNELGKYLLKVSESSLEDVDIISFMVEPGKLLGRLDSYIFDEIKKVACKKILILNKVDLLEEDEIESIVKFYEDLNIFEKVIPMSALNSTGVDEFVNTIKSLLDEGPKYYPEDMITESPERFIVSEIIREKILNNMEDEIPHGVQVEVESMKDREDKDLVDIHATIHVEKKSHKPMLIGKNGSKISIIGREARLDIEKLLGTKVNLQLWVKVTKDWRSKESMVKNFGYK